MSVLWGLTYEHKNPNGKYGSVKGVQLSRKDNQLSSKFFKNDIDIASPTGLIYTILDAFRALLDEKEGMYVWKKGPFEVAEKLEVELVESTVSMSRSLGNNPNAVGKDSNIWKQLYMTVASSLWLNY